MKLLAILAIITIVVGALTATARWIDQGGYNRANLEHEKAKAEADKLWQIKLDSASTRNDTLSAELYAETQNIKTVEKQIIKKVKIYVKNNVECNFSRGGVGVLNSAYGYPVATGMPKSAELLKAEAEETSTTGKQDFVNKVVEFGGWCLEIETRFDKLVKACN